MEEPISASLGAMGPLLRKLDLLLEGPDGDNTVSRLRLHKGAERWTHLLRDDLEEIASSLKDLSEVEDPPLTAKCWMKEVRELSYDIENYVDSFVLPGHVASIESRSGRRRRQIRHIKVTRLVETTKKLNRRKRVAAMISDFRICAREAIERHKRYELHCCTSIRRISLKAAGRLPTTYAEEGAGIIMDDRMSKFMDSLADDRDQQLKVVSVVGPDGIGKTTFVKVLYHKLKGQFDCRVFIRLNRKPDIKTILRDILAQVQQQQEPHNHCEDPDLIDKIREHLQYKRYLIAIDDLWSASIWDVISYAFPGGRMCSRIITSTQTEDVALACCCYHSEYVFKMRPLDGDLSRELFLNSLFCPESDFPQKLKEVLNKIIKICGGLPLATTVIASLLATHPVILMEQWAFICDSLISKLRTSSTSEGMKVVVNFGYNNLTCHLKTCLLYLSMYPEGCTVWKDDLMKQWVAEGFIDGTEGQDVETAESYFHELIGRRFLQPECIKYNGEVVSCSVHDVVRDLIAHECLEENFVMLLDRYRRNVSLYEKVHRLSLRFPCTKYAMTNIRSSQVRSLTYFGLSKYMPSIREFKLLRVLNLNLSGHDDNDGDLIDLTGISELLWLRYIKVASDVCVELPKQMGGLQYLETLDISKKLTNVPLDIIHLPCLLHLHLPFETNMMNWLDMMGPAASVWSLGKLTNLRYLYLTYSIPVPDHLQRNMEALGSLFGGHGSLKTLAFILSSAHKNAVVHGPSEVTVTWEDFAPPLLERFEWLPHICSFSRVPKWVRELGNLRILKISVRELMRDGVSILGGLPALTILSLYVKIAPVERITFDKTGFSVLKYFKFMCSTVPWLKFEADAMPNLQKLKLAFSAHMVDQESIEPICIIEHLPGLKDISAKVGGASSDVESALRTAFSNHPRNPRIRVQSVDWNFYGHGVWYTVSKQGTPSVLEEDKIPDPKEGLDDHCVPQYKDSRGDQDKEAYVSKRRRKEKRTKHLENRPYVIEESVQNNFAFEHLTASSSYASKVTYASPLPKIINVDKSPQDILSTILPVSCTSGATNPQQHDSKIERCQVPECILRPRGPSGLCTVHGDGRRCQEEGCQKNAEGKTIFCKAHSGGRRCQHICCTKSAEGRTDYCIAHGGARRCIREGCKRIARGKSGLCLKHGGGRKCRMKNCIRSAEGRSGLCIAHGGGRRCQYSSCRKGAEGSTMFCKVHGGGRRCAELGCKKSVHGDTQLFVAHGGRKRCAISGCHKFARGRAGYCAQHESGKRCQFQQCIKSAQGCTNFYKAHGGGKRSRDQLDLNFNAGAQDDRLARSKTGGHSSADSTSSIEDLTAANDAGTSGPAIDRQFAAVQPNQTKIADDKGDPPRTKSNDDKSERLPVLHWTRSPFLEARVHGEGLIPVWQSLTKPKE